MVLFYFAFPQTDQSLNYIINETDKRINKKKQKKVIRDTC